MKKILYFPLLISCGMVFFLGCTNDSSSDLIEINQFDEVTYTNTVKSIIDNNCISCHATTPVDGAPMPLNTYELVKNAVLTQQLLDRISRDQGASGLMPEGTRMPQVVIDQVIAWNAQGLNE